jgi:hypothetical protein
MAVLSEAAQLSTMDRCVIVGRVLTPGPAAMDYCDA